jgi:hypothetical protein
LPEKKTFDNTYSLTNDEGKSFTTLASKVIKTFSSSLMLWINKLERLSLVSSSCLVKIVSKSFVGALA